MICGWIDNGIVHIEINSPISIFTIILVLWVQYSVVKTDKGFLMASNHGVLNMREIFSLIQIQVKLGISVKLITSISSVIMKELIFMKTMSFQN
jgi:hypothetical protein